LFDKNIFKSISFPLPIIGVGNLSVGGTGKSPMIEYLINLLQHKYHLATLSRGYKRRTKGYALANENTTASEIGDEPMQFHEKFKNVAVAVGEKRGVAIPQLLRDKPETDVILLDDSFQHRKINPGFNILLTEYNNHFTRDFYLPTGDLRDQKSSYKRANVIVVTKCPNNLSKEEMFKIKNEFHLLSHQKAFFTTIAYGDPYHILTKEKRQVSAEDEVLVVCGIANPKPLKKYLSEKAKAHYLVSFPDHHIYTEDDVKEVSKKWFAIQSQKKIILTTEKDAVRLVHFQDMLAELPMYVIPVQHLFLAGEGTQFDEIVNNYIETFQATKKYE
jgi:tetraacyldisaccharide 4'-kinase